MVDALLFNESESEIVTESQDLYAFVIKELKARKIKITWFKGHFMQKFKARFFTISSTVKINLNQYMIGVDKNIELSDVVPVYTDGSCINNGRVGAVSSIGVYFPTADHLYINYLHPISQNVLGVLGNW